jgi:hypothetical protein
VGVTQLPNGVTDGEVIRLDQAGVRAVRINLKRGDTLGLNEIQSLESRMYELVGWHLEFYLDSAQLAPLYSTLVALPSLSIAHLACLRRALTLY